MTDPSTSDTRPHQFPSQTIDLAANLAEARLNARACVRCGDEYSEKTPVEAWSEHRAQGFECVDAEICTRRVSQLRLLGLC